MTPQRTLVIVNPAAGGGRAAHRWRGLRATARAAFRFEEVETSGPGDATRLAREAATSGYTHLLAVGGDGTLHEVVNGTALSGVSVGLLPLGTGNDFARSAHLLRSAEQLLAGLASGRHRVIDLGLVHGQYYLNVAGVGFDAEVAREVNALARKGGGTIPYLLTAVRDAFRYDPPLLTLTVGDGPARPPQACLLVAIGNASAYGGGMRVCPGAVLDDGLLDVLTVREIRAWAILGLLPKVFVGRHLGHPQVKYERAAEVHIEGPPSVALHADGEIVGGLPATFTVVPRALALWVPG